MSALVQESGVGTIYSHHQEHAIIDGGKSINRNGEGINNRHDQNRRDGHSNGVNIEFRHGQDMNSITKGAVSKNDNNYILAALRATQIIDPKAILPAEIMASMLDFLSVPDLLVMARTGRRMREMVYDDTRWVKRLRSMGVWDEGEAREGARTNIESKVGEPTCSDAAITSIVNPGASVTEREQDALRSGFTTASIFNSLASDGDDNATDRATYALNVMSRASSVRGSARQEYGKIYATLNPYYTDILENCHASTITPVHSLSRNETAQTVVTQQRLRLFNLFETPEEQGQMLSQLYRFAQSDFALGCCERIAAVASVVTAFEGVALHKFEQGIEANDTDNTMARYARVLVTLNGGDSAVDTFILRNPRLQDLHTFGDPLECFKGSVTATVGISLQPLHDFFQLLCEVVMEQLNIVTRVFPSIKVGDAVRSFLSCVADKILADYATTLLDVANKRSREAFVKAVPALFEYCIRIAEAIVQKYGQALGQGLQYNISREIFEILVLQILNPHVKIYLRKELEYFSHNAKTEVSAWEKHLSEEQACTELFFMSNVNRQAAKRDFLSSFRKVVMMPISVVSGAPFALSDTSNASGRAPFKPSNSILEPRPSLLRSSTTGSFNRATSPHAQEPPTTELAAKAAIMNSRLEGINALFSIEVALNIVHCAKASIERMASFVKIGGELSGLARMQCEAVFVQLLQTLGTGHVKSGFDRAVAHLGEYKPRAVAKVISNSSEGKPKNAAVAAGISPAAVIVNDGDGDPTGVAPLVTFLELVNVGDLIQQMLDVFYSQELVATRLIDRDDFLNLATKEKKRFEQMLDERVAAGLNKGIDVLMAEVELICATIQQPADYNPSIVGITASRNAATATSRVSVGSLANTVITAQNKLNAYAEPVDVRPTDTARAVVALVSSHTNMLIGSTERTMLDVFNQEVGLRLFGQLCQHIKRQRISTSGAIKLISDLNLYSSFIGTLRNKDLVRYFSALREISQMYLIDSFASPPSISKKDINRPQKNSNQSLIGRLSSSGTTTNVSANAKEIANIISDVRRFDGIFEIEELYEFAARRADWLVIKTEVEKVLYGYGCEIM